MVIFTQHAARLRRRLLLITARRRLAARRETRGQIEEIAAHLLTELHLPQDSLPEIIDLLWIAPARATFMSFYRLGRAAVADTQYAPFTTAPHAAAQPPAAATTPSAAQARPLPRFPTKVWRDTVLYFIGQGDPAPVATAKAAHALAWSVSPAHPSVSVPPLPVVPPAPAAPPPARTVEAATAEEVWQGQGRKPPLAARLATREHPELAHSPGDVVDALPLAPTIHLPSVPRFARRAHLRSIST